MNKFTPNSGPTLTPADVAQYFPDDQEAAAAAFASLMQLAEAGLIDIYLPAGWSVVPHRRFNVWIGDDVRPPHGARVTLAEWLGDFRAAWNEEKHHHGDVNNININERGKERGKEQDLRHGLFSHSCANGDHAHCERDPRRTPFPRPACECPCHDHDDHDQDQDRQEGGAK